jgi:choline dehydrogenase-like flavoprotein
MLIDARELDPERLIECDVCLIGAGAAGITLARSLSTGSRSICVLESGAFSPDRSTQALYEGDASGTILGDSSGYLSRSRLRYFGGSTNHWSGFCRPLDEDDFEERSWIPHSGWPIRAADLAAFYDRAAAILRIDPFTGEDGGGAAAGSEAGIFPDHPAVLTCRYHFSRVQFRAQYEEELAASPQVTVIVHANVTAIEVSDAGTAVTELRVATLTGRHFAVRARLYVLAAGGVENARLLLASDRVQKTGLGNGRDLVGRFFMEHLEGGVGFVALTDRLDAIGPYRAGGGRLGVLCLTAAARREHGLLHASVELNFGNPLRLESEAGGMPLAIGGLLARVDHPPAGPGMGPIPEPRYARCIIRAEQSPNPESRVTLNSATDALGLRQARLQWQVAAQDGDSLRRTLEVMARELGKAGIGRGLVGLDADDPWPPLHEANHHIGTTRMGHDPATSVVDADGKVHGIANLYVAGSSLFPTAGFANPTLTIVALALRQAEHLGTLLAGN